MRKKKTPLHPAIKECLGYESTLSDKEFLDDWKARSTHVCKPCWELKYCPYGPFVEQSPLLPPIRSSSVEHNEYLVECLKTGMIGNDHPLSEKTREAFESLLKLYDEEPESIQLSLAKRKMQEAAFEKSLENGESLVDILGGPLPPIHQYRPPFPFDSPESDEMDVPEEIRKAVEEEIQWMRETIKTGVFNNKKPLTAGRKAMFEEEVSRFDPDQFPESIPEVVTDLKCNIFGHICPIVFVGENISETTELRRRTRYIPFHIKMRVVRRDNHTCQECGKHLRDDEVEFDHIIPVAKGGSTEEHNIRLTCFDCNRSKSDKIEI